MKKSIYLVLLTSLLMLLTACSGVKNAIDEIPEQGNLYVGGDHILSEGDFPICSKIDNKEKLERALTFYQSSIVGNKGKGQVTVVFKDSSDKIPSDKALKYISSSSNSNEDKNSPSYNEDDIFYIKGFYNGTILDCNDFSIAQITDVDKLSVVFNYISEKEYNAYKIEGAKGPAERKDVEPEVHSDVTKKSNTIDIQYIIGHLKIGMSQDNVLDLIGENPIQKREGPLGELWDYNFGNEDYIADMERHFGSAIIEGLENGNLTLVFSLRFSKEEEKLDYLVAHVKGGSYHLTSNGSKKTGILKDEAK